MHEVRDGVRILQFDGDLLASSTSQKPGGTRWVEFELYKTRAGSYILSRIGCSVVFHAPDCKLVGQYNLKPGEISSQGVSCDVCYKSISKSDILYPEKQRYWAQVMERPAAILEALYKYDRDGTKYLTLVAQRLLGQASAQDEGVRKIYQTEYVL